MAKKKLNFQAFEKCHIPTSKIQKLKGGYKYLPQGAQGNNFIGTTVDIRNANIVESTVHNTLNSLDYLTCS